MTFDYGRFFVISLLVLFVLGQIKCQEDPAESDERLRRLEDFVRNEILKYLTMSRQVEDQQLEILGQNGQNESQLYDIYDNGDSNWLQSWYNTVPYPQQFASWQNRPPADSDLGNGVDSQFFDSRTNRPNRRPMIPAVSLANREFVNAAPNTFPNEVNDYSAVPPTIPTSFPPLPYTRNRYMPIFKDRQESLVPTRALDDYRIRLGQLPPNGRRIGSLQGLQNDGDQLQFSSNLSGSLPRLATQSQNMRRPPIRLNSNNKNLVPTGMDYFNGSPNASIKSSQILNNGSDVGGTETSSDFSIDQTTYRNNLPNAYRNTLNTGTGAIPRVNVQEISSNSNAGSDTNMSVGGSSKPANKKYKVLIVDGDTPLTNDGVNIEDMHREFFSSQGLDSVTNPNSTKVKKVPEESRKPKNQQSQSTFQTVSVADNGNTLSTTSPSKSASMISFQGGSAVDGSTMTTMPENQTRDLSGQYNVNSGFGGFKNMKILPATSFQNVRLN